MAYFAGIMIGMPLGCYLRQLGIEEGLKKVRVEFKPNRGVTKDDLLPETLNFQKLNYSEKNEFKSVQEKYNPDPNKEIIMYEKNLWKKKTQD